MSEVWMKHGTTMLFIGDSITDCGRRDAEAPFGNGYMSIYRDAVIAHHPERAIRYLNKGIGGNRISDLRERWRDDVLLLRPDRLSIKIGINDLHSGLRENPDAVSPELFAEIYDELLALTSTELGCPVVLLTPFYIAKDADRDPERIQVLELIPRYIETVEAMSAKYGTRLVRLHDLFQEHLKYREADDFCPEPVHPNHTGHVVITEALFEATSD